jgi:hypothetical protein
MKSSKEDDTLGDQVDFVLHQSLKLEELRQTSPSRIAYHRNLAIRGGKLPLGKCIGLLLWLNDHDFLSDWGGARRLVRFQRRASLETLLSAIAFRESLNRTPKKQCDFFHHAVVLNAPFFEKLTQRASKRRIGIGYRDKGTLPNPSTRARLDADKAAWFPIEDIGFELADGFPREGDWVDLSAILTQTIPDA